MSEQADTHDKVTVDEECKNLQDEPLLARPETNHVFLLSDRDSKLIPPYKESDLECIILDVETNTDTNHADQPALNDNLQMNTCISNLRALTVPLKTLLNFQA